MRGAVGALRAVLPVGIGGDGVVVADDLYLVGLELERNEVSACTNKKVRGRTVNGKTGEAGRWLATQRSASVIDEEVFAPVLAQHLWVINDGGGADKCHIRLPVLGGVAEG